MGRSRSAAVIHAALGLSFAVACVQPARRPATPPAPVVPEGCLASLEGDWVHADDPSWRYHAEDDGGTLTLTVTRLPPSIDAGFQPRRFRPLPDGGLDAGSTDAGNPDAGCKPGRGRRCADPSTLCADGNHPPDGGHCPAPAPSAPSEPCLCAPAVSAPNAPGACRPTPDVLPCTCSSDAGRSGLPGVPAGDCTALACGSCSAASSCAYRPTADAGGAALACACSSALASDAGRSSATCTPCYACASAPASDAGRSSPTSCCACASAPASDAGRSSPMSCCACSSASASDAGRSSATCTSCCACASAPASDAGRSSPTCAPCAPDPSGTLCTPPADAGFPDDLVHVILERTPFGFLGNTIATVVLRDTGRLCEGVRFRTEVVSCEAGALTLETQSGVPLSSTCQLPPKPQPVPAARHRLIRPP